MVEWRLESFYKKFEPFFFWYFQFDPLVFHLENFLAIGWIFFDVKPNCLKKQLCLLSYIFTQQANPKSSISLIFLFYYNSIQLFVNLRMFQKENLGLFQYFAMFKLILGKSEIWTSLV